MGVFNVTGAVKYVGVDDKDLDLFESQYDVPNGMAYNSYVIIDEKVAVMDSVDASKTDEWLKNLDEALEGKKPDYLVIDHVEPDHSGSIMAFVNKYPEAELIGNAKTFQMLEQFFEGVSFDGKKVTVKEGDEITLGSHTLTFIMAAMVHWPEVMVTYEKSEGILFSADAFGKFGTLDTDEDWACEARRYYFNIVGKYGMQVQALLKKAAALDIKMILALHGPLLTENLDYYIGLYDTWSSYKPEGRGVTVAYASIHGNTKKAALELAEMLKAKGAEKVSLFDLSRDDIAEAVEDSFRYDRLVLMASSYDAGVFPPMEYLLLKLKAKTYRNRTVAIVENGSWAPSAGRVIKSYVDTFKDIDLIEPVITIRSSLNNDTRAQLEELADKLVKA